MTTHKYTLSLTTKDSLGRDVGTSVELPADAQVEKAVRDMKATVEKHMVAVEELEKLQEEEGQLIREHERLRSMVTAVQDPALKDETQKEYDVVVDKILKIRKRRMEIHKATA